MVGVAIILAATLGPVLPAEPVGDVGALRLRAGLRRRHAWGQDVAGRLRRERAASRAERIAASRSRGVASAVESSPNPAYSSAPAGTGTAPAGVDWTAIASCESNGSSGPPDWSIDTGNGYYGGLQFDLATWQANGGVGNPAAASPAVQIAVAERVYAQVGLSAWPVCGARG